MGLARCKPASKSPSGRSSLGLACKKVSRGAGVTWAAAPPPSLSAALWPLEDDLVCRVALLLVTGMATVTVQSRPAKTPRLMAVDGQVAHPPLNPHGAHGVLSAGRRGLEPGPGRWARPASPAAQVPSSLFLMRPEPGRRGLCPGRLGAETPKSHRVPGLTPQGGRETGARFLGMRNDGP